MKWFLLIEPLKMCTFVNSQTYVVQIWNYSLHWLPGIYMYACSLSFCLFVFVFCFGTITPPPKKNPEKNPPKTNKQTNKQAH